MSLDFELVAMRKVAVFERNITHNLTQMADAAGLYNVLWRPSENGYKIAKDIIPIIEAGLSELKSKREHYEQFNAENGWGKYEHFVPFVQAVLDACYENPDAEIKADV